MPAEVLSLSNFDSVNLVAKTKTDALSDAGQKDVDLESISGFTDESWVVIDPLTENAELGQIDSIAGQVLTLKSNLTFDHLPGAQVWQLVGNQLKLYRAANVDGTQPADTDFAAYTSTAPTNPVTIQPDQSATQITDPDGGSDYWYKAIFWNSAASTGTSLSQSLAVRGGDFGHYTTLDDIRDEAGFSEFDRVTDVQVNNARIKAEAEINSACSIAGYTLPFEVDVPLLYSVATLLAAGFLLTRAYGSGAEGTNKDGIIAKNDARKTLTSIQKGELMLVDAQGNQLPTSTGDMPTDVNYEGGYRPATFGIEDRF